MSGIPRSREGELLKKEKGPLGAKWTRKLVVVDGRKGTVRYHRPTDDKSDVPRKIFHLKRKKKDKLMMLMGMMHLVKLGDQVFQKVLVVLEVFRIFLKIFLVILVEEALLDKNNKEDKTLNTKLILT